MFGFKFAKKNTRTCNVQILCHFTRWINILRNKKLVHLKNRSAIKKKSKKTSLCKTANKCNRTINIIIQDELSWKVKKFDLLTPVFKIRCRGNSLFWSFESRTIPLSMSAERITQNMCGYFQWMRVKGKQSS